MHVYVSLYIHHAHTCIGSMREVLMGMCLRVNFVALRSGAQRSMYCQSQNN
jgi:hypothetical protein